MHIHKLMDLTGRRALVTGAAGHLGRVISQTLGELGADLILVDRDPASLKKTAAELLSSLPRNIQTLTCNLEVSDERCALVARVKEEYQELNILVNNAAFVGSSSLEGWAVPFKEQSVDTWRRAIEVNLTAAFELSRDLLPMMENAKGANIINIASIYGEMGPVWELYEGTSMASPAAYAASKAGLIQFSRWVATTAAPSIRVNALSPGGIYRGQPASFVSKYEQRTPLKRMATEFDFAGAIAFLASDMSSYMTGQNISVDGGWGAW